ncbi:MAG: CcoQ/FixQ family Cbb3-type cytochrome c oxidase assembly chaperone [Crocinitomicaceae bacterium]
MLKYIKGHMASIDGIEWFPIISFIIFFSFFIGLIFYVITMKKKKVEEMKNIPLENGEEQESEEDQDEGEDQLPNEQNKSL